MGTARTVAVNTAATYARMVLSVLFGLLATRLLYTILGASKFGLLAAVGASGLLTVFVANALASAAQRDLAYALGAGSLDEARRMLGTGLRAFPILAAGLFAAGMLAWPLVASWLTIDSETVADARGAYVATIFTLALTCAVTPLRALLVADQSLWLFTLTDLGLAAARLLSVLGVWLSPARPLTGVGIVLAASTAAACAGNAVLCWMRYPSFRSAWREGQPGYWRRLIGLAGWSSLSDLAWQAQLQGSAVAMNSGYGNAVSAGFAAGQQVAGYQSSLTYAIAFAARPAMAQLEARGERDAVRRLNLTSSKYAALAGALFSVPLGCDAHFWLKAWLKEVPVDGAVFLPILLGWRWILGMGLSFDSAVLATRRMSKYVIAMAAVQAVSLSVLVTLVVSGRVPARFSAGTLLVGAIVQLLLAHVGIGGALTGIDIRTWWREACRPALLVAGCGIGVALALRSFLVEGWPRASLIASASLCIMLACAWHFLVDDAEKRVIRQSMHRRKRG